VTEPFEATSVPPARDHPRATWALVLGLISLGGALFVLPAALGPVACYLGASARRTIEREPGRWSGHGQATAGLVLGAIASALLALLVVASVLVAVLFAVTLELETGY